MKAIGQLLRALPWLIAIAAILWVYIQKDDATEEQVIYNHQTLVQEIEDLGKLELVKYNFKEITEVKKISKEYLRFFKLGPDSKIAIISVGEATGCIDLTKIKAEDVQESNDTIFINLPKSELCYYKLDMEKSRIYSLETNPMIDKKEFIQDAYKSAESEIREAALNSGILERTRDNAELILKPMLERMSGKVVIITERPESVKVDGLDQ
ncbi:DUF4230 domain-containing protein [Fulvivirga sp.]|uniref:DUF4230 domain-containing protein n=1 Tax=Fulvivirga sp. TaxID=1931237 RepID=UPI0032F0939C